MPPRHISASISLTPARAAAGARTGRDSWGRCSARRATSSTRRGAAPRSSRLSPSPRFRVDGQKGGWVYRQIDGPCLSQSSQTSTHLAEVPLRGQAASPPPPRPARQQPPRLSRLLLPSLQPLLLPSTSSSMLLPCRLRFQAPLAASSCRPSSPQPLPPTPLRALLLLPSVPRPSLLSPHPKIRPRRRPSLPRRCLPLLEVSRREHQLAVESALTRQQHISPLACAFVGVRISEAKVMALCASPTVLAASLGGGIALWKACS